MNRRYALLVAAITAGVLLAHSVLAFTKMRWVTGLLEIFAALVLWWQVWMGRKEAAAASARPQ